MAVWISNFAIGVAVPPMLERSGTTTYLIFAFMCMLCTCWAYLLVPETKGKTLEEMDEMFGDLAGREEHQVLIEATETTNRIRTSLENT